MRKYLTVSLILLLLLFQTVGIAFAAEQQVAGVDIPVVIEGGGTAYMIPGINCPLPEEISIQIDNGRTGHFYINFTETGKFRYTIKAGFLEDGEEREADAVFHLTVTVYMRVDGTLYTVSVINGIHATNKTDEIRFEKTTESTTQTPDTPTFPDTPSIPDSPTVPDTSSTTHAPSSPDTPTTAGTPNTPSSPNTPGTPETPETPGTTVTLPSTPETPGTTGTPSAPRVLKLFITPKTGDESHLIRYILIAISSAAGLFCLALLYTVNTNKLIKKD